MIDLHTHTILSDGALLPAELVRRAEINGYKAIALTDHVDSGNMEIVLNQLVKVSKDLNGQGGIKVLPGVEITHMPPSLIPKLAEQARRLGAKIVVVHGESPVEPVAPKTNWFGLQGDIDILAHPGMITEEEIQMAKEKGIYLEISARRGHCLTNGRLVSLAKKYEANLVINTDAHQPKELFTKDMIRKVGLGAGLTEEELQIVFHNSEELVNKRF
ncbi:MAG: histidinol phosphate phosphatase domain-containing protein [candidate division Zixibacteria bacterium]|nr:histidinol phosphate phosphatase domain-containing protein [candidate division Zixibacteria bacterium]